MGPGRQLDVRGTVKILAVGFAVLIVIVALSAWLDDRVEALCDGVWVERPDGSTNCVEGAQP